MLKRLDKDDRGFSLIELIVCILMVGMITGIITIFVVSSTNSYNRVYNEVNMQTEADIAMTYINDIAVEAKDYAVAEYTYVDTIDCKVICMEAPDPESATEAYCYYFIWQEKRKDDKKDDNKYDNILRFCKVEKTDPALKMIYGCSSIEKVSDIDIKETLTAKSAYENVQNFLAQYVTEFSAVPPTDKMFPVLQVNIKLQFGGSSFVATKNIASRNLTS